MLTHQHLSVGDEQEATQTSVEVKELHKEIFCDVVRTAFCLQLLKWLCQDSVLKLLHRGYYLVCFLTHKILL